MINSRKERMLYPRIVTLSAIFFAFMFIFVVIYSLINCFRIIYVFSFLFPLRRLK